MEKENKVSFIFGISGLFGLAFFLYFLIPFKQFNYLVISNRFWFFIAYLLLLIPFMVWGIFKGKKNDWQEDIFSFLTRIPKNIRKTLSVMLVLLPVIVFLILPTLNVSSTLSARWIFSFSCILGSVLLWPKQKSTFEQFKLVIIFSVILGTIFSLGQLFNQVSSYPFSLGWSEGNRLWDYSIKFGSDRYTFLGEHSIKVYLDQGRALVWGWIYLIPNIGIWGVRLWDAIIKSVPYFGLGLILIWPERKNIPRAGIYIFVIWVFLFIRQGPIHTPLVLSAILTVLAVQMKNLGLGAVLVIAAAYLAQMTRFNWAYAPSLWAGMLALLHIVEPTFKKLDLKKLIRPLILGLSGYFGGQFLPVFVENIINPEGARNYSIIVDFQNSRAFAQDLLWDRWWPNLTYGAGIIASLLFVVLPVIVVLFWLYLNKKWKINWMQILGVLFPGLAFLIVGLIASVKIGGGGDLHNLDMFLIFLILLIGMNWRLIWEYFVINQEINYQFVFIVALLIFPTFFSLQAGNPLTLQTEEKVTEILGIIQNEVDHGQENGGEVLFMDQRQLITFDTIKDVILIDDYEKKYLIDYSFVSQTDKLVPFYTDISDQRFSLIISNVLKVDLQYDNPFSEENNYWVEGVVIPILEYYEPIYTFEAFDIQLLVPIEN